MPLHKRGDPYSLGEIVPRHFLQTAAIAGLGAPLVHAIFEDLAANAVKQTDAVIESLPPHFPEQLVTSVREAMEKRTQLLAGIATDAAGIA